ncbi:MAG: response regulator [Anaerolineae bacterium]|nr:response regulator [Anaerolineae bacterium]NUQ06697.1 response regulator [Anaerolineae bacterium]
MNSIDANGLRALVVEDDAHSLFVISLILQDLKVHYKRNTTGAKSVQQLMAMTPLPDFVLLDLDLPGADAFSILRKLTHDPKTRHIPIIAIGDSNCTDRHAQAIQIGAAAFLQKPFARRQFAELIAQVTGRPVQAAS